MLLTENHFEYPSTRTQAYQASVRGQLISLAIRLNLLISYNEVTQTSSSLTRTKRIEGRIIDKFVPFVTIGKIFLRPCVKQKLTIQLPKTDCVAA